jgi:plastocyanin
MPIGFTGMVTIPEDAPPGTYEFICDVPAHAAAGMVGTITVDPNAIVPGGQADDATPVASPGASPSAARPEAGASPAAASPAAATPAAASPEAATPEGATPEAASPEAASPAAGGAAAGDVAQAVRLEGFDIGWRTPDQAGPQVTLNVAPGQTIELVNVGAAPHNLQVDGLGINEDMPVGYSGTVTVPEDAQPGEYEFICNVPGHSVIMYGTMVVQ